SRDQGRHRVQRNRPARLEQPHYALMKYFVAFAIATWVGFALGSTISVFGLDSFDRKLGPRLTYTMILWYALIPAVVAGIGAFVGSIAGAKARSRVLPVHRLLATSAAFGVAVALLMLSPESAGAVLKYLFYPLVLLAPVVVTRMALMRWGIPRDSVAT